MPKYTGNLKAFLDETCRIFNQDWEKEQEHIEKTVQKFEEAMMLTINVFGKNDFGRIWLNNKEKYERQRNSSLLDTMLFYFSDTVIRERVNNVDKTKIEQAFKTLCSSSADFISSVKSSTNTIAKTHTRLALWGETLRKILEIDFEIPELIDNRIVFSGFR